MGLNRYYVPNLPQAGDVNLTPDEVHHAVRVRREKVGAECILFDGLGHEAAATFARADKREAVLHIKSFRFDPKVLSGSITLGVAMPKGDRQKDVIEKAVELGVHCLVPILTQRSVSIGGDSHLEKWRRHAIESCKQCERNQLMEIESPQRFTNWIEKCSPVTNSSHWIAHPMSQSLHSTSPVELVRDPRDKTAPIDVANSESSRTTDSVFILVGPEGGFTDQEAQLAIDNRWQLLDLGPRILRVETAVSMASVLAGLCIQGLPWATVQARKVNSHD